MKDIKRDCEYVRAKLQVVAIKESFERNKYFSVLNIFGKLNIKKHKFSFKMVLFVDVEFYNFVQFLICN